MHRCGQDRKSCLEDRFLMRGSAWSQQYVGLSWLVGAMIVGLTASPAAARISGIVGYSGKNGGLYCSNAGFGCHSTLDSTRPPLVRFEGPTQVDPGAEVTYRFV